LACRWYWQFGRDRCDKKLKPLRCVYGNIDDATARMEFRCTIVLCVKESMFDYSYWRLSGKYNQILGPRWRQIHQSYLFAGIRISWKWCLIKT
jgi:hypothetical protein